MKSTDTTPSKRDVNRKRIVDFLMIALVVGAFIAGSSGYGLVSILSIAVAIALASWRFQQPPEKGDSECCSCGHDSHHHHSDTESDAHKH